MLRSGMAIWKHSAVNRLFTALEAEASRVTGLHPRSDSWLATGSEDRNPGLVTAQVRVLHATFHSLGKKGRTCHY